MPKSSTHWPDPAAFGQTLVEVFRHESWTDIESCAERAWTYLPATRRWQDVRAEVRACWDRVRGTGRSL